MIKVKFKIWDCELRFAKYAEGATAIQLFDLDDGAVVAKATVNMPEVELAKDEIIIKDYAENEGMLKALEDAGIVKATGRYIQAGWCRAPVAKLLISKEVA